MTDEPIYCLTILLDAGQVQVHGHRSDLQSCLEQWRDGDFVPGRKLFVEGITNTADRASQLVAFDAEHVQGMTLWLMA